MVKTSSGSMASDSPLLGMLSPRRNNTPLEHPRPWHCTVDSSRVLEESTVVASVLSYHKAQKGTHTVYDILVNVRFGSETISAWRVCRRYNAFHKLHGDLKKLSFPCPELPPKALLSFNTTSFLDQRKAALNLWLQGCLCIWQSVRIENLRTSYEIAQLMETFLCEADALAEAHARGGSSPFQFMRMRLVTTPEEPSKRHSLENATCLQAGRQQGKDSLEFDSQTGSSRKPSQCNAAVGVATIEYCDCNKDNKMMLVTSKRKNSRNSFRPFMATVQYPDMSASLSKFEAERHEQQTEQDQTTPGCTPVSVPPTPEGQSEFLNSWSQYTETVLEYVASRLEPPSHKSSVGEVGGKITSKEGTLSSGTNSAATVSAFGAFDDVDMFEEEDCDEEIDALYAAQAEDQDDDDYVAFETDGAGSGFVFRSSTVRTVSRSLGREHDHPSDLQTSGQAAGDYSSSTAPLATSPRERIETYGVKLIRKVLTETCHAVDFVGSSYEFVASMNSVLILHKKEERKLNNNGEKSLHCYMGRGAIECSAEQVFELVRDPSKRHHYDRLAKAGSAKTVEVLEGAFSPVVFHHALETKQRIYFLRHSRDFCILQFSAKLSDGRFVVAGRSVRHGGCPEQEGIVRCQADLFGWVIEPIGPSKCKATYLLKVDFGGNVPTRFLDSVSFRQPLCIRYVEEYLKSSAQSHGGSALSKQCDIFPDEFEEHHAATSSLDSLSLSL